MPWYDLLERRFLRFRGEVKMDHPSTSEVIVVDDVYYRWSELEFAFIEIEPPDETTAAVKDYKKG